MHTFPHKKTFLRKIPVILLLFFNTLISAQEICDNGIDDDNDFLVDLNDTADCACKGISGSSQTAASLIPNASFEQRNCCPSYFEMMSCATNWIQATLATTDYHNTCGYVSPGIPAAGLLPFPDGTGAVGTLFTIGWQEYLGACLLQPLLAGETYQINLNVGFTTVSTFLDYCPTTHQFSPIDIVLYGNSDCSRLPILTYYCPDSADASWKILGTATYTPSSSWSTLTLNFSPTTDIHAVIIGSPCTLPPDYPLNTGSNCLPYFIFDNLVLNHSSFFTNISIREDGNHCANDFTLAAHTDTFGGAWQWFHNGVALAGETDSIIEISANGYGYGDYTARYSLDTLCESAAYRLTETQITLTTEGNICEDNLIIRAEANNTGGSWQWYHNGSALDGETGVQLSIPSTTTGQDVFQVKYETITCDSVSWSLFIPAISISEAGQYCTENLVLNAAADSAGGSWQWYFDVELPGETSSSLNVSANELPLGEYRVNYTLGNTCAVAYANPDSCVCSIVVPQAFVPEGNPLNRVFKAFTECPEKINSFDFKIFNRWGETVFASNDIAAGWDGTYKGNASDIGVYTYLIRYKTTTPDFSLLSGNLTLIR